MQILWNMKGRGIDSGMQKRKMRMQSAGAKHDNLKSNQRPPVNDENTLCEGGPVF